MPIFKKAVPLPKVIRSQGCSFHFSHLFLNREIRVYIGVRKEILQSPEN